MRFYAFSGRLIGGLRLGLSFGPEDFARAKRSSVTGGFVYVLTRPNGDVKIGVTRNPPQRLRALQTGAAERLTFSFIAATTEPCEVEAEAQRLLNRFRMRGEWFETSPEAATAAVSAAAARLGRRLLVVDAAEASRKVPPVLQDLVSGAERRRAIRNAIIVALAIAAGGSAAWKAVDFVNEANVGTPYETPDHR